MTNDQRVTTERCGYILLIGLKPSANLREPETLRQLAAAVARLEEADDVRCGVLFSYGSDFSGPASNRPFKGNGSGLTLGDLDLFGQRSRSRVKPIICAVQGRCDTWATKLALAQDAVIATDDAVLELLGCEIAARDAQEAGIVQEVVSAEQHLSRAIEIAIVLGAWWGERPAAKEAATNPRARTNSLGLQQVQSMWG